MLVNDAWVTLITMTLVLCNGNLINLMSKNTTIIQQNEHDSSENKYPRHICNQSLTSFTDKFLKHMR